MQGAAPKTVDWIAHSAPNSPPICLRFDGARKVVHGMTTPEEVMLMTAEGIKVPVIVMAGFPDFDEEEMKQFPNVKKMFHKPLYPEDVLAAVREYARK